jgi:hypothetical protein
MKLRAPGRPEPLQAKQFNVPKGGLGFADALHLLENGRKVSRVGWSQKGAYIWAVFERNLVIGETDETQPLVGIRAEGTIIEYATRIDMKYANGKMGVWTPTVEDLFAKDWSLLT